MPPPSTKPITIVLLGDEKIGKSTLCHAFVKGGAVATDYDGIPFDMQTFSHESSSKTPLQLRNTSGKESLDTIRSAVYAEADVILLCFSSLPSLESVKTKWAPEAKRLAGDAPTVLVSLKCDLYKQAKNRRLSLRAAPLPETENRAWKLCRAIGAKAVISVSARTGERVEEALHAICKLAGETHLKRVQSHALLKQPKKLSSTSSWIKGLFGVHESKEMLSQALYLATLQGDVARIKELLAKGARPSWRAPASQDPLRQSAMHVAVASNNVAVVHMLINAGGDLDLQDDHGNSPLSLACREGRLDIAKALLERGAKTTVRNLLQNTPLHEACGPAAKDKELVTLLIKDFKANVRVRNANGETPRERAEAQGLSFLFQHNDDQGGGES